MSVTLSEPPPAVAAEQVDWTADVREGYLVERRRDFPLDSIFGVMRLHRDALEQENGGAAEIFQRSSRTAVGRCRCTQNPLAQEPDYGANSDVCVKSFWSLPVGQRVKDALRLLRRPRRSLRTLKKLLAHGIPTARPLAAVTRRDPTIVSRVWPVAEAFVAITLLDHLMMHYAYQRMATPYRD